MLAVSMATGGVRVIVWFVVAAQVAAVLLCAAIVVVCLVLAVRWLIRWSRRP